MGKTFKDKRDFKVKIFEERGYSPRLLEDEYKRIKLDKRKIEDDIDEGTEESDL